MPYAPCVASPAIHHSEVASESAPMRRATDTARRSVVSRVTHTAKGSHITGARPA